MTVPVISMELLLASGIALLTAAGIYLCLRRRTFSVVLGLAFLSYAINLFLFSMGRLVVDRPPLYAPDADYADPLPQAMVLTAIVISFGMTAVAVVLSLRTYLETGSDDVDAGADGPSPEAPGHAGQVRAGLASAAKGSGAAGDRA